MVVVLAIGGDCPRGNCPTGVMVLGGGGRVVVRGVIGRGVVILQG